MKTIGKKFCSVAAVICLLVLAVAAVLFAAPVSASAVTPTLTKSENILAKETVTMSTNLIDSDNSVANFSGGAISGGYGARTVNALENTYTQKTEYWIDGEATDKTDADVYLAANMAVRTSGGDYSSLGMLIGYVPGEGGNATYLTLAFEPQRGFLFLYWNNTAGGADNENIVIDRNLGITNGNTYKVEVIKHGSKSIDVYLDGEAVVTGYVGEHLGNSYPAIGTQFNNHDGTLSDFEFCVIGENVTFSDPSIEPDPPQPPAPTVGKSENFLTKEAATMSGNVFTRDDSVVTYSGGKITGNIGNRSVNPLGNIYTEQTVYTVDGENVAAKNADVYLKCTMKVGSSGGVYSKIGMMVGKIPGSDGSVTYLALEFEPGRGYAFLFWSRHAYEGAPATDAGESAMYTKSNLGLTTGNSYTVEVIKHRTGLDVWLDGTQIAEGYKDFDVYLPDALPVIGGYFSNHSGELSDFEFRVVGDNVSVSIADTRPTFTSRNLASDITQVSGLYRPATVVTPAADKSIRLNLDYEERLEASEAVLTTENVWVEEPHGWTRYVNRELATYISLSAHVTSLKAPHENWYGFGVDFRRTGDDFYTVRLGKYKMYLMINGQEVSNKDLHLPYSDGVDYSLQILSEGNRVSVWVNGRPYYENYLMERDVEPLGHTLAFVDVYADVTLSDITYGYIKDAYAVNPDYSDDATLKAIYVGGKALDGFAADKYAYDIALGEGESTPKNISFVPNEPNATVQVSSAGTQVKAAVTSRNGAEKCEYTLRFVLTQKATIDGITFDGALLDGWSESVKSYAVTLSEGVEKPSSDRIGVLLSGGATYGIKEADGGYTVEVKLGARIETYTVTFVSAGNSLSTLGGIYYKGELIKGFASDVTEYNIALAEDASGEDFSAVASASDATVQSEYDSGTLTVTVTAADGTQKTYTVTVSRKKEGGCGSSAAGSASMLAAVLLILSAAVVLRKRSA